jgi:hypothetical protein
LWTGFFDTKFYIQANFDTIKQMDPEIQPKPEERQPLEASGDHVNHPIHALRTYQGDVEEAMHRNNTSTTDIFLAEQKRKGSTLVNPEAPIVSAARNKFFILTGSILLLLGILTIGSVYYLRATEKVTVDKQVRALIGFSEEKVVPVANLTRGQLLNALVTEKQNFKLPVNSVLYVNTIQAVDTPESIDKVLKLLAPTMPDSLIRSFDKYMLGVYSFDTNEPFIILTTNDFSSSFAGMLKWEHTMTNDVGAWFGLPESTSTPFFIDEEFRNKDLRLLKDEKNKTILLYSFIDKNTLIITKSENVFTALVSKYLVSGQVK